MDEFEEFRQVFDESHRHVAEVFDIPGDIVERTTPEVVRKANISPQEGRGAAMNYDVARNEIQVSPAMISRRGSSRFGMGSAIGSWLREYIGPGDQIPEYLPERHFYQMLGSMAVADYYGEELNIELEVPEERSILEFELDGAEDTDHVANYMTNPPEDIPGEHREFLEQKWELVSSIAGKTSAKNGYDRAVDDDIVYMPSQEVREHYISPELNSILDEAI